jgi:hypothetical protein
MQMEERGQAPAAPELSAAEVAHRREIEVLRLSRKRLLREIETTASESLRTQKERALAFIENRIRELNNGAI